jgi:hypothetical protein
VTARRSVAQHDAMRAVSRGGSVAIRHAAWILPSGRIEQLAAGEDHVHAVRRLLGRSTRKSFDPFAAGWIRQADSVIETRDLRNPQLGLAFAEAARVAKGFVTVWHPGGEIEVPVAMGAEFLAEARAGRYSAAAKPKVTGPGV